MESTLIPVAYFGISSAISLIALNVSQTQRVYFAPFLLLFALLSFSHLNDIPSWQGLNSLWGLFITIYIMHITAVLYIEKWVLVPGNDEDDDKSVFGTPDHDHRLVSWNLKAAYKVWSNPRWLPPTRTRDDNNNTEVLLSHIKQQHRSTNAERSAMTSFILIRTTKLCAYGLIHHLIATHIFPGHFRPMTINDFSPYRERYLSRLLFHPSAASAAAAASGVGGVQLRETLLRAVLAVDWVIVAYLLLEGCHHLSAMLFVCVLRLDEPEEWPMFFGSIWQITSVQRFWGGFWHRLVVGPYGSHAAVLSRGLLGFEAHSWVDKLFVTFCIFLFSGLAHSAVSWQMGQRCGVWRDVAWFVANFGAGAVEAVVQRQGAALAKRIGLGKIYHAFASGLGGKIVGLLWVFAFFFWSVPKWQFPKIYCATLIEIYNE